jgi:hypothetical protein
MGEHLKENYVKQEAIELVLRQVLPQVESFIIDKANFTSDIEIIDIEAKETAEEWIKSDGWVNHFEIDFKPSENLIECEEIDEKIIEYIWDLSINWNEVYGM